MPSVKFDVDVSSFKNGISSAKSEVKTLDQQMKMIDATFKATGNSEQALAQKTQTLNSRMTAQKTIADQAKQALDTMTQKGIDPASESYQKMARELLAAQTGMMETQAALNSLSNGAVQAAGSTDKLEKGLNGISRKISLDQVISGIDKIKGGLDSAVNRAKQLGQELWNTIMDSAKRADDVATQAEMFGIDIQKFKQMQALVTGGMDTTVEAMLKSQSKLNDGIGDGSKAVADAFAQLNVKFKAYQKTATGQQLMPRDTVDLFWEAGQALVKMGDDAKNAAKQESIAQTLFGKSWKELKPLFDTYKTADEYNEALKTVSVSSEEATKNSVELADRVGQLENTWTQLKDEVVGAVAPGLTKAADALDSVLSTILEYLKTPQGQENLTKLGDAIAGLFGDLEKIDPDKVIQGFVDVFNSVTGGIQWLVDNAETAKGILATVVGAWGAITIGENVLKVVKLIDGIQGLTTGGAEAGALAGASWGGAFAKAVLKAAPWLLFLYNLLNPNDNTHDKLGNSSLTDENGNLTPEAVQQGFAKDENGELYQDRREIISKAVQDAWDLYRSNNFAEADLIKLQRQINNDDIFGKVTKLMYETSRQNGGLQIEDLDLTEILKGIEPPKVPVDPEPPKDASKELSEEIGTVNVPVVYVPTNGEAIQKIRMPSGIGFKANGIWSVPRDNYLAVLHQGERVVPARQVQQNNRSYSSNLYVEKMVMNNGQDAEGLAQRIATAQRRTMSGYGS